MPKEHVVKLTIKNHTKFDLKGPTSWFDSGRVADGWNIPKQIPAGTEAIVEMYERDDALAGCSGYINYVINDGIVTFAFSNPSVGSNKVGCGVNDRKVWDKMDDHSYKPFAQRFSINEVKFVANESCSGGKVNKANVELVAA